MAFQNFYAPYIYDCCILLWFAQELGIECDRIMKVIQYLSFKENYFTVSDSYNYILLKYKLYYDP